MTHPLDILKYYWNYTSFRSPQEEVIMRILNGKNTLVLLPTGGGKSLCFQVPAMAKPGICIVVSPLIALIRNQVDQLRQHGIKATALAGKTSTTDIGRILDNCRYGEYKFLYLSPERLQQELVQQRIKQMNVNLIAIDEAHCISQWGNDFRPAYRNCNVLSNFFPDIPVIALTASATHKVIEDILKNLQLREVAIIKKSFARKNIAYRILDAHDKLYQTVHILKKNKGSAIVYVRNRKAARTISDHLNREGIPAAFYHGGISTEEKNKRLSSWIQDYVDVMVATNAFGMGIDKPDVKTVIHVQLPDTIENYYQETGRAGRNGEKALAVLLHNNNDSIRIKKQFLDTWPDIHTVKTLYKKLNTYFQIPYGEGQNSVFTFNFNAFCTTYNLNATLAYNSMKILDRNAIINYSEFFSRKATVQFTVGNHTLFAYLDNHPRAKDIIQTLLRTYGGIFDNETFIDIPLICRKTTKKEIEVKYVLEQLHNDKILIYKAHSNDVTITFLVPREDHKTIHRISAYITQQRRLKKRQIRAVLDYVNNTSVCRTIQLCSYFGEKQYTPCDICSVCIDKKEKGSGATDRIIQESILKKIAEVPLTSRELAALIPNEEGDILRALRFLLAQEKISITDINTYKKRN